MKIIQTFWSRPGMSGMPMNNKAGWLSAEYHWMSWALSCLQAKKFYHEVELVTDQLGKEILIDRLQLPYTKVTTSLDTAMQDYPAELWSLAKIFAYGNQHEPFIHIDGDVYLWQAFTPEFMSAPLVAQNVEVNIPYYRNILTAINNRFAYLPSVYNLPDEVHASNTGIFGGHDLAFIKEYCRQAFEFVDKNKEQLQQLRPEKRPLLNFIFEQYLLFYLAAEQGRSITYFWQEEITDPLYSEFARFIDIPAVPLIHPVGAYKQRLFTCTHVGNRLRKDYPGYYYRIIEECKNEVQLVNKYYYSPGDTALLNKMVDQFARTANLFEYATAEELRASKVCTNEDVKLTADKASWLEPEQLAMQEVMMDQLEMLIVSLTASPVTISFIIEEMRCYFDADEIRQNESKYEQLIIDTIKHLLYLRILVLCAS